MYLPRYYAETQVVVARNDNSWGIAAPYRQPTAPPAEDGAGTVTEVAALVVFCGLLGLLVGSFLALVAHRAPRRLSVVRPRSACPQCGTQLSARDTVPVLSWLVLRGRCRWCGAAVSARYAAVEAATGALFAAAALTVGADPVLPALLAVVAGLCCVGAVELAGDAVPGAVVGLALGVAGVLVLGAAAVGSRWGALAGAAGGGLLASVVVGALLGVLLGRARRRAWTGAATGALTGVALGWLGMAPLLAGLGVAACGAGLWSVAVRPGGRPPIGARLPAVFLIAGLATGFLVSGAR
jgi:leader peptidase (prepilin peptidase)/N-methyltransferase